ncbi:MAG: acetyl-CoA carboxylase, carboxyltransferase subunit beta [Planctomycetota bacterium]|nr:acetyl-CoA carboxylase, carboxyltransferase subunit beta [Planctomycetota bacterium]
MSTRPTDPEPRGKKKSNDKPEEKRAAKAVPPILDEPRAKLEPEREDDGAYGESDVTKEDLEAPLQQEKRSRWKKKEMPGGLWLKCESCGQMIYRKELEEKGMVCPACEFHFTLPGRARVKMVMDEGTFEELYAELTALDRLHFRDSVLYSEKVRRTVERTKQNEALILGTGTIDERPIVLAVLDFSFMGGSMGEVVGEKIALACDLARTRREPLVIFTSSGGARMHEGMLSLMQMAKTSAALASLNESGGFSICVLTNPTTGGVTASFASVCDVTLAEPGALIGFAGPRVIATTLKQELPPGFQRAEFLVEKGQVDAIVRRSEMRSMLARLIDFGARAHGVSKKRI